MLTDTMIQNIEQLGAEFNSDHSFSIEEIIEQADFQFDAESYDSKELDNRDLFVTAFVRGAVQS